MLGGKEIDRLVRSGEIVIDPYEPSNINPNSYNVGLDGYLLVYRDDYLDPRIENRTCRIDIPDCGLRLKPGVLYLGSTIERTYTPRHIPRIDGRSSIGRLGLSVHITAGFGDVGFNGKWTLEITCVEPVVVYPGMRIAQISFSPVIGEFDPYAGRYQGQSGAVASRMNL